ncbi:hypothetical protein GJ744_004224 [Endocarpon pusillum]|uniref:Uncharacterized protein n=1 Tax=Endocarpon pusillum TaxID=364733 RepID=A0A8H7A9T7_9EURO|nr:hypothetical protein GJ744_004224 [Endocarpon pusillum]
MLTANSFHDDLNWSFSIGAHPETEGNLHQSASCWSGVLASSLTVETDITAWSPIDLSDPPYALIKIWPGVVCGGV